MSDLLVATSAKFSFGNLLRNKSFNRIRKKPLRKREAFSLEPIESRLLLSAVLVSVPDWQFQGPAPMISDANEIGVIAAPGNAAGGAIESAAIRPIPNTSLFQIYAATVNGGVWRSSNVDPANPGNITWTPLTDQQASLAMGSIAFSPLDASGNTLFVGTGSFSNLSQIGGPAVGVLRTTDGGATWNTFRLNPGGNEPQVKTVLPTSIDLDAGAGVQQMVLVGTLGQGLFRSNDNGQTYTPISGLNGLPPNGNVTQLVADPNNMNQFYAAVPGAGGGVFQGLFNPVTGMINWTPINTAGLTNAATSGDIQIAVTNDAGNTVIFALVIGSASGNQGAFRSVNGGNWTALAQPPGIFANPNDGSFFPGPGQSAFFITADPVNSQVAYITGYSSGNHVFRFDPTGGGGTGSWEVIMGAGGNTRPHPDGRGLFFLDNTTLVEVNDGGIYYLSNPITATDTTNNWRSFNGNTTNGTGLGAVEMHNIAWDSLSNVIVGGSQDNGTEVQQGTNDIWTVINGNDGGDVLVDNFTLAGANQSIRYFSGQNLGGFSRQVFDAANNPVGGKVALGTGGLAGFVPQFVNPIEINAIAPTAAQITAGESTRVVIGGGTNPTAMPTPITVGAVYESNNAGTAGPPTWTQVQIQAGATGAATAFAYGGRLNGVDNPEVLYVGLNGGAGDGVFVRSTAGGMLTATTTPFPGANVVDITLDPNDWQHAFVASSTGVWETTNAGQTWIPRTGDLASLTSNIRTIEFAEAGDVDAVLVGAWGGVFRMLTNNPGVWSEFGAGLPNAIAFDLDYNAADDPDGNAANGTGVLLVGTFGRGAWTVDNASDFLTDPGVLVVTGDEDGFAEDDEIRLVIDAANPSLLDVFINGQLVDQFQLSVIQQINVDSLGGNDTLIVDSTNGLINVANGIRYDGGSGVDDLQLVQTGGPTHVSDTYTVGPANGSGVSTIVGGGTAGTQVVFFENLSPVIDLVPVALLTVNATASDNAISYSVGSLVTRGLVTIDAHEPIEFSNKTALTINAGSGQDTINLNNAFTPDDLDVITINGGDPSGGDTLIVTGAGRAVTVNTATGTIIGAMGTVADPVSISYGTIETLNLLAGIGDLTITTTAAADTVVVTPGVIAGSNSGTVESSGAVPQIAFVNSGFFTANLGGGNDALVVNGSPLADTIAVSGLSVAIAGRHTVNYTGVEALTVNGNAGSDTFTVTPAATVAMFIDGGDPVGQLPGDLLNIVAGGASVTFNVGPGADEGSFVVGGNQPVSFDHIESIGITGGGSAEINGTSAPDAITVIARDASTHLSADGIRDFTVAVNGGPALLFIDVPSLTVNAGSGSDVVTLAAPAPNNAAWNVNVTVNGGTPAADTDQLIVQTPGAGAESVTYTPDASDGGTLELTSITSLVSINGIDVLSYDGLGDGDSLTVVGTDGDDTIVHTPGANDQAGSFQVNTLLALGYQNLGSAGSLKADGGANGTDTLLYNGTNANDSFTIDGSVALVTPGQVNLNFRLVLNTTGVEILTLEGLSGDDTFTLVPAISDSVYSTINLNGGDQASATGDRVNLIGTPGNDDIFISGQWVTLGGVTVKSSGIENISLNANGGNDLISYTGVIGVTDNITVSSSGVAGGGQVRVPGVALINFSGVEQIEVNGNVPGPNETDTLTFEGTNNVDRFEINLAADGTAADPILRLFKNGSPLLPPLLTLQNYTNFNTLNVLGLDGTDTFNVKTDADSPDRNLFVDGGLPSGKKKSTDNLNVIYTPPRPSIIHSSETQDPDNGIVDLDYGTARFVVQYDDIEQVTIRRL